MTNKEKSLPVLQERQSWYAEGLRFKCTECGQCCTGSTGYVWVTPDEMVAMAEYLKLSLDAFVRRYIRLVDGHYSLKERVDCHDCLFLRDKKCQIYPVRPEQCRQFPWWLKNLESPEAWQEAATRCEGIDHKDAPLVSFASIQQQKEST